MTTSHSDREGRRAASLDLDAISARCAAADRADDDCDTIAAELTATDGWGLESATTVAYERAKGARAAFGFEALDDVPLLVARVRELEAENAVLRRDYLDVADAACRESAGPADVVAAIHALRRQADSALAALKLAEENLADRDDTITCLAERLERRVLGEPGKDGQ